MHLSDISIDLSHLAGEDEHRRLLLVLMQPQASSARCPLARRLIALSPRCAAAAPF